jgi:CheY-like chemotaxis protein
VPDGEQAIDYLAGKGRFADRARHPLPALVLLDINMPKNPASKSSNGSAINSPSNRCQS